MAVIKPRPYKRHKEHILSAYRLDQLSVKMLKAEYFKLAERLLESRKYNQHLHSRIKGFRWLFRRRRKRRTKMYHLRILKASHIRKKIKTEYRLKLAAARVTIRKAERIRATRFVKERVQKALAWRIPKKVASIRRHYRVLKKREHAKFRKTITRQLSKRTRKRIFQATVRAKETATIGLIKKTKLPSMGRYAGIYALVIKDVSRKLSMRFADVSCLVWFGTYESFNIGGLTLMYPHMGSHSIRLKVNRFVKMGYLQCIGKIMGRKTYVLTPLGKEFHGRILRYAYRFRKPYLTVRRIPKKVFRMHFKTKKIAKP